MSKSRFGEIDFSLHIVSEINPELENVAQGFKCSRGEFVSYIKGNKIKNEIKTHTSRCWGISCDNKLASYITLLADKLTMDTPILIDEDVEYTTFPAVKIGWLAADKRAKGAGSALIDWVMTYVCLNVATNIGVRFITVDALYDDEGEAIYDASHFYLRHGFRFAVPDEEMPPRDGFRSMYFDLKPMIEYLKANDLL
jgi:hypothetical protein